MKSALLAIVAAALATGSAAAKTTDPVKAKHDANKLICRSEPSTGSRLSTTKQCMTAQEWDDLRLNDRQSIEKRQVGGLNRSLN